jgi:hypothetical protein
MIDAGRAPLARSSLLRGSSEPSRYGMKKRGVDVGGEEFFQVNASDTDPLIPRLDATRKALRESQRRLPRGSASWKAIAAVVRDIDALTSLAAGGRTRSNLLNLNTDSDLPIKPRTSGRRQGVLNGWGKEAGLMSKTSLEEFAEGILEKGRIGKYDVQALQQEVLAEGVTSRAVADLLIALDRQVGSVHFSWSAFFISSLTEFAVWQSGRPGYIDEDKSKWLLPALAGEGATDRARRALVAIAQEAECFDEAFFAESASAAPRAQRREAVHELGLAA